MYEPPCRHIASALLAWYLHGALHADQHAMVRDHVEGCDVCAGELEALEAVASNANRLGQTRRHLTQDAPPPDASRRHGRRGWLLAMVLVVPVVLGLVWMLLGAVRGR